MVKITARQTGKGAVSALALFVALAMAQPIAAQARSGSQRSAPPNQQVDERPRPSSTRPLPEIVARVQATPPYNTMDYIGVAGFQTRQMVYILRFIDGRQVVVVYVDARSGRIVGRAP